MSSNKRRIQFIFVNSLTLGRIPLILIFLIVSICVNTKNHPFWFGVAVYSMILSALTDLFDGWCARKFNMVTKLGAYADPLTDKIFYLTEPADSGLSGQHAAPATPCQASAGIDDYFSRPRPMDLVSLRSIGAMYNVDGKANWSGKARTIISFPTICCIFWYLQVPSDWRIQFAPWFIYILEVISLIINFISIWVYTVSYWPCLSKELKLPPDV